jgi:hypothetical protein
MPDIQECEKLVEEENWSEATGCFQQIMEQNSNHTEARQGFNRARRGEEAFLYFQQAKANIDEGQLDEAFGVLTAVVEYQKTYNIRIKNAKEMLDKVVVLRDLRAKRAELQRAKQEKDWSKAVRLLEEIIELDAQDEQAQIELDIAKKEHKLQLLYQQLLKDIAKAECGKGDWSAAEYRINQIKHLQSNYNDISELEKKVENNKRWVVMYSDIKVFMEANKWDEAINECHELIKDFNDHEKGIYEDIDELLKEAKRARKLELDYQRASDDFENDQLEAASGHLNSILVLLPNHKKAIQLKDQVEKVIKGKRILSETPDRIDESDLITVRDKLKEVKRLFEGLSQDHAAYQL